MLALLGFVLAVIALVSNLVLAWLKVPRIVVQVAQIIEIAVTLQVTAKLTASAEVRSLHGHAPAEPAPADPQQPAPADPQQEPGPVNRPRDKFILTVINTGSEAITVRTIGFQSDAKPGGISLDWEFTARHTKDPQPEGPNLPVRIEGHGCEIWTYEDAALERIPNGTTVFGYAMRYKTFRIPPRRRRKLDKMHFSERSVNRNGGSP